jgi:glycosyltransferase involved in cell wall biosynthesis
MEHSQGLAKRKMSIIFYHPHPAFGSIEEQFSFIVREFNQKDNWQVSLFCPQDSKVDRLAFANNGKTAIRFPVFANGPDEIRYLYKWFKKIKPDIIHINELSFKAMIAANLAGIKRKILTYHSPTLNIKFNWKAKLARSLAFNRNWDIIATTKSLKEYMARYRNIKAEKIKVINYGVDKDKVTVTVDRKKMRASLGIADDAFVLINVARLCKEKAQHIILESIRFLPLDLLKKIRVLIVGEGEGRTALERLITQLSLTAEVVLTGHRQDIANLLNLADVFVLSSFTEGACISLMEAGAQGLPVVATDIFGVRDTVQDGKTGLLVAPEEPKGLAEAIELLAKDKQKARALGLAGRERFHQYFTKERMLEQMNLFYQNTAKH